MKLINSLKLAVFLLLGSFIFASNSFAQETTPPEFPTCSNPGGTLRVSYADGQHAIVGESGLRVGADAVYDLEGGNVQQCFCSIDGGGVQTNWWKISSLNQEEIDTLVKLGWNFVPSGTPWGLDASAYMARNEAYACGGGFTTTSTSGNPGAPSCTADRPSTPQITSIVRNGSSATISWTKIDRATHYTIAYGTEVGNYPYGVPNTGNVTSYTINELDPNTFYYYEVYAVNDCMPSEASTGGQVLGTGTGGQVLGLASTGNLELIFAYLVIGAASIITGILLKKRSDRKA